MPALLPTLLLLHGAWRWVVLAAAVWVLARALTGLLRRPPFQASDRRAGALFVGAIDFQFLLGLGLYVTSPLVRAAWQGMAAAMKVKELRFFAVEHTVLMLAAVALAHVGAVRVRRAANDPARFRRMLLWNAGALVALLAGMPWWRPLLRALHPG